MSKILYITQRYAPAFGGAEIYVRKVAQWSVSQGHEVDVWTSDALEADALWYPKRKKIELLEEKIDGVNIRRFKTSPFFLNNVFVNKGFRYVMWHMPSWHLQCLGSPPTCIGMYMQLLKSKKKLPKYDIIHVSAMPYNSLFYVGMYLAKKLGAKLYITPFAHSNVTGKYILEDKYFHPRVIPFYYSADKIFVQTDAEKNSLIKFFDTYKGKVSPSDVVKYGYDSFGKGGSREDASISSQTPQVLFLLAKLFISIMAIPVWISHGFSKFFKKSSPKIIDTSKFVKVGLGVEPKEVLVGDGAKFRSDYGIDSKTPIVFFVGAREAVKGVNNLVNACEKLWEEGIDFKLAMAGNSSIAFEEFWAQKSRMVKENSIVLERPDDETKWNLFDAGNIFVMTSKSESFGIVYLEAWLYKKPVIGCNIESVSEVISEGVDGYLLPFDDTSGLVDKIRYLIENSEKARDMGENGYRKVMSEYTWEKKFSILSRFF
ncbi:glycosyltransferase family 4 protein [Candidatus Dojkabacteria bacterium]|nr:glycosyltransferase family 4 protein [Candidatus Dojkabacteria bacterium]